MGGIWGHEKIVGKVCGNIENEQNGEKRGNMRKYGKYGKNMKKICGTYGRKLRIYEKYDGYMGVYGRNMMNGSTWEKYD